MNRFWRGLALASMVALTAAGCDSEKRRTQGPNPYRREVRDPAGGARTVMPTDTQPADVAPTSAPAEEIVRDPQAVAGTVLFVNGEAITVEDILATIRDELEAAAVALPPREYFGKLDRTVRDEMRRQISEVILFQEASRTFTEEQEKQIDKRVDAVIQERVNHEFDGLHAKLEEHLATKGETVETYRKKTKRRFVAIAFLSDQFKVLAEHPSRSELKKYYDAHLDEFTTQPRANVSLIETRYETTLKIPRQRASSAEIEAAKRAAHEKMLAAQRELESGVPFAAVAKAYSEGVKSADGGAWGEIGPNSLRDRYKVACDAVFTMTAGQVSDILAGPDAYFIVRCDAIEPQRCLSFEEAQLQIQNRLLDQRYVEKQNAYINKLLRKAVVTNDREFRVAVLLAAPAPKPPQEAQAPVHP